MSENFKVLFVCLGNICRSPAGENVMRHLIKAQNISNISIDSAGTAGYHIGKAPDSRMSAELKSRGIHVTGAARQFQTRDYDQFDLIVPMDLSNEKNILKLARNDNDRAKVKPFMSFCQQFTNNEVPDPYYDGADAFTLVADMMHDGCQGIIEHIQNS